MKLRNGWVLLYRGRRLTNSYLPQRDCAAFLAISFRYLADMPDARALPPILPSSWAALFLPSSARKDFLNLPRRDPHDVDGIADHVRGALLAFGASGHYCPR